MGFGLAGRRGENNDNILMKQVISRQEVEVATHISEQRQDLEVLFVSGYSEEALSHIPCTNCVFILEKPYTAESLLRAVRQVLDNKKIAA